MEVQEIQAQRLEGCGLQGLVWWGESSLSSASTASSRCTPAVLPPSTAQILA